MGVTEGTLIFKKDEAAAKASINDPIKLVDMALSYGVSYDLLTRVASPHSLKVFETLGIKALLDKVIDLTTETERHQRFEGIEFSFGAITTNGNGAGKQTQTTSTGRKNQSSEGKSDSTNKRRGTKVTTP